MYLVEDKQKNRIDSGIFGICGNELYKLFVTVVFIEDQLSMVDDVWVKAA